VGACLLWPQVVLRERLFVIIAALSILVPVLVALIKFHTFTSYHTWLVKFATVCVAPSSVILLIEGPAWPFQVASIVSLIAGMEEILITLLLTKPQADIPNLLKAIRMQNLS
jgi:CDP-diacylglycerol--glycerol-3-phosphate 3-phosphatidyltransferase